MIKKTSMKQIFSKFPTRGFTLIICFVISVASSKNTGHRRAHTCPLHRALFLLMGFLEHGQPEPEQIKKKKICFVPGRIQ